MIVDDESIAHDIINKYCSMLPNMKRMQDCYDAMEAIDYLNRNTVDLLFLDLNMPKLHGFEFLKTLPYPPKVIVTTAYKEHALEGYELNITDYLLKPFSFERFLKAVNKACMNFSDLPSGPGKETVAAGPERIFLRSANKHIQVALDDILFLEASGNNVKIVLKEELITIRGVLSSLLEQLPADDFIQVHRSYIIAHKHIKSIEGNQVLIDKYEVPVGKLFRSKLDQLLK